MTTKNIETFSDLNLIPPLQNALALAGYEKPTPIQKEAIPPVLSGRDLLGCAQTGTGKTAAFALPLLQLLAATNIRPKPRHARALILTPTRELAIQVHESFSTYGKKLPLKYVVLFGGVGITPQINHLSRGADVIVATPGRLLDLINQGAVKFSDLEIFVLDEADRMLDMGFIKDIKKILKFIPQKRHNLFFSATMPPVIEELANTILHKPVRIEVTPVASTAEKIDQSVMFVSKENKRALLKHVLSNAQLKKVIVFSRTKHGANKVATFLQNEGITAAAIHGDKSQNARQTALNNFKQGSVRVLVATDIAARGIDIDGITHVINFELPNESESYVHRIGRTARAGADGAAISFCDLEEKNYLRDIEKLIAKKIPVIKDQPFHFEIASEATKETSAKAKAQLDKERQEKREKMFANKRNKSTFSRHKKNT